MPDRAGFVKLYTLVSQCSAMAIASGSRSCRIDRVGFGDVDYVARTTSFLAMKLRVGREEDFFDVWIRLGRRSCCLRFARSHSVKGG
jgi:hypothetical protein